MRSSVGQCRNIRFRQLSASHVIITSVIDDMLIFIRNSTNKDLSNMVSRGRSNKQIIFSVQFINSFLGAFTTRGAGVMKNFLGAQPWEGARESKVIEPW